MSEFKNFKVGELFDVSGTRKVLHGETVIESADGDIAYIVRKTGDNGIKCYTDSSNYDDDWINDGNVITFAQDTFIAYYQDRPFITGNKIKILKPIDFKLTDEIGLYVVTGINKIIGGKSWGDGSTKDSISNLEITLPATPDGTPDWDAMTSVIKRVEAQHIKRVDETLAVAGFKTFEDTVLTAEEEGLLTAFRLNSLPMRLFKLSELFTVLLSDGDNKPDALPVGTSPLVTSGDKNTANGIVAYVQSDTTLFKAGSITLDMFGHAFYQNQDFYAVSHGRVNVLTPKHLLTENAGLYLTTAIRKVSDVGAYGYSNMLNSNVAKSLEILLPTTPDNTVDFDTIEKLQTIFTKLTIRQLRADLDAQLVSLQNV